MSLRAAELLQDNRLHARFNMPTDAKSPDERAIRLLRRQLEELQTIRTLNYKHPDFKAWRDTTSRVLEKFLGPESPHTVRFRDTRFFGPTAVVPYGVRVSPDYISPRDALAFQKGCDTTDASLRAAIRDVEDFGAYVEQARPVPRGRSSGRDGAVSQTFHGPVTFHSQAIATDGAIQNIERMGDTTGASLQEVADLLQRSEDLTPRQVKEGLAGIESLALEVQKPEAKRNWKSVLDCGQSVLAITDKATDLVHKLAPHTKVIVALLEKAKHLMG